MEIRISKPSRVCNRTEREFEHGDKVVSMVRMDEEHFVRQDFSEEAWEPESGQGAVAVWTTAYNDPRLEEQAPPESFSPLRQIFYESVEGTDRIDLATAFLSAELLRRQKIFKLLKQSDDPEEEAKVALYNDKVGNRLVEVRDPNLLLREMEAGRQRLVARLKELEGDEEDGEAAADDASGDATDEAAPEAAERETSGDGSEGDAVGVTAEESDATLEEV